MPLEPAVLRCNERDWRGKKRKEMIAVMAKTPDDNVSRGACAPRSACLVAELIAELKAPISPQPTWSEMGRIPDSFSELTAAPVLEFAARTKQYKQPCCLPLTSSNIRKILAEQSRAEQSRAEQSRAEQSRAEQSRAGVPCWRVSWPPRPFPVAWRRRNNSSYPTFHPTFIFQKFLSGFCGIQDMLWATLSHRCIIFVFEKSTYLQFRRRPIHYSWIGLAPVYRLIYLQNALCFVV